MEGITHPQALELSRTMPTETLLSLAREVSLAQSPRRFDSCSIINAKSGRCPEDCHWCAQSAHYKTNAPEYKLLPIETLVSAALESHSRGIGRFSFVTSGRALNDAEVDRICGASKEISRQCEISLCASAGFLTQGQFTRLREAGIVRYHCNLETAPSYFDKLCATHSQEDKIHTLSAAREAGMELCSGGIIGMGESIEIRIELAFRLKELNIKSIPINILHPISGTPLGNEALLCDDDVLRTVALFRLILPDAYLRLAGGAERLTKETLSKLYSCAINAAIMGDMLTTKGAKVEDNFALIRAAGYFESV